MAALSVVLTRFASVRIAVAGIEGIRLGLGTLPNILAGIVLGPAYGALSGAAADIVGFMLSPMGGYMPHFTLTAALSGAIPGLVFLVLDRHLRVPPSVTALGISVAAGTVLVSWCLTPYFLHTLFGLDYRAIVPPRLVAGVLEIPVYAFATRAIYGPASRLAHSPEWQRG